MKKSLFLSLFIIALMIIPRLATAETLPENSMKAAAEEADEARKKAGDFEGDAYFPSEWEAAEAKYAQAAESVAIAEAAANFNAAADAYDSATAAYNEAKDIYDSIYKLTIPLYAQAREDEIMAYRNSLIYAGARDSFPVYFPPADKAALLALSQYEEEDFYSAKDSADRALQMFQILAAAYDSWLLRHEIYERDFSLYDPDNYEHGREFLSDAMDAYNAEDLPLAMEKAEESLLRHEIVLSAGWSAYAELRAQLAEGERQAALDTKANITAKAYFSAADLDYNAAKELFEAEQYKDAAKLFTGAEALFIIANTYAQEKQSQAITIIREANERLEKSEENAKQAEIAIEGAKNES